MSWWAKKLAETLTLNDEEEQHQQEQEHQSSSVKEDLNELTQTLSRQFWGVASFLAPPPSSNTEQSSISDVDGIRTDLAEIGGKLRSGIMKISDNIAKADFSKIASELMRIGEEDGDGDEVDDEVVDFVKGIAARAEIWLDFPLPNEDDEFEFDMTDAQQEHALAVERLVPRLAALRIELCPSYMSESCFWMIYFVLLHPHLNEHDAELLSTPEIEKARAVLTQEMQNKANTNSEQNQPQSERDYLGNASITSQEKHLSALPNAQSSSIILEAVPSKPNSQSSNAKLATDKHPILSSEVPIVDKSVIEERPINQPKDQNKHYGSTSKVDENFEDEADDWLKEESSDTGNAGKFNIPVENDEDVSFSDLEEDDGEASTSDKKATYGSDSSTRESREWVQLGRSSTDSTKDINTVGSEQVSGPNSESKESSDWLDLEEIDVE